MAAVDGLRICLDTGPLIHYLRGREPGASVVEQVVRTLTCYVTAITSYELLFGAARARRWLNEQELLGVMAVLSFDQSCAQRAARLHAELIGRNLDIGVKDMMIASICLAHDLPLLTTNVRHFERVPSLRVLSIDEYLT